MRYIEDINATLHQQLAENPSAVVLGEDILDPYGGAFKATRGLSTKYPERVFTTPICEASIVGMAVGMALRGVFPIAELMFGDFITLGIDQIINHAAKFQGMYNDQVKVPMVVRTPMGGGRGYGPTHSQSLEKMLFGTPLIDVVSPSLFQSYNELFHAAIQRNRPVIMIEDKLLYPEEEILSSNDELFLENLVDGAGYPIVIVKNYQSGKPDVTIVSYGGISRIVRNVLKAFKDEEIRIMSIWVSCLSPLSVFTLDRIRNAALESKRLILIEEGSAKFGWTSELAARIREPNIIIVQMGALNTIIPAAKGLENSTLVNEDKIQRTILEVIAS
jgi:pyruvate/2-oxoglutarate/acetoin dehydrogenase E1 component